MPGQEFSDEQVAGFTDRYPALLQVAPDVFRGKLKVLASFDGHVLDDEFDIEICRGSNPESGCPVLKEIGGRTDEIATKRGVADKCDLHVYRDGSGIACLCAKQEERIRFPPGSTLIEFVENLVVPYLYGLSYFDQNGRWPWPEYSHGTLGLLEYANEHQDALTVAAIRDVADHMRNNPAGNREFAKQLRRPGENRTCPCGSQRPFRKCHRNAWQGLLRVRNAAKQLDLDLKELFPDFHFAA